MTAKEAKETASNKLQNYSDGELKPIMERIEQSARNGQFCVVVSKLHELSKAKLEADGYNVKYDNYYDPREPRDSGESYTISWN